MRRIGGRGRKWPGRRKGDKCHDYILILKTNGRTCVLGYDMLKQISMLKTHAPLCMHVCVSGTIAYNSLCWKFQVLNVVN